MEIRLAEEKDLEGITHLNQANLKRNLLDTEKIKSQGYVSWEYSLPLLQKMHLQHPSVIALTNERVVGYALIAIKQVRREHPEFNLVLHKLDHITYQQKPLSEYNYYAMGQVCIEETCRGQGIFDKLFQAHKQYMQKQYDFVVTTISPTNLRSIKAHERIGFTAIHEFEDHFGSWVVVLWDWT